jgi:hypothetical protein
MKSITLMILKQVNSLKYLILNFILLKTNLLIINLSKIRGFGVLGFWGFGVTAVGEHQLQTGRVLVSPGRCKYCLVIDFSAVLNE